MSNLEADLRSLLTHREGKIIIDRVIQELKKLWALEAGGVDNWDWYSESLKPWYKEYYPEDLEGDEEI
jgi:hypothetical protein